MATLATILLSATVAAAPAPRARPTASASLASRLDALLARAPVPEAGRLVEARYEGVVELEAHFRKPGEKRRYRSRRRFLSDGHGAMRLDWTTWSEGDTTATPESWLSARGTLLHRDAPDDAWREVGADKRDVALAQVLAGVPWELARRLRAGIATEAVRVSGRGENGVWSVSDGRSPAASALTLSPGTGGIVSFMTNRPHPRLGDVRDGVMWVYPPDSPIPTEVRQVVHERDQQWSLAERRVSLRDDLEGDTLLAMPASFLPALPADSIRSEPTLSQVAPGLWAVDMEDLDTRSLIVEFGDRLAVLEAAVGSENGERIVSLAKRRWPSKPIRHFLFSHYHPHYAGGIRALVAEGATVVATPGNEAFVRQSAARPFRLKPDRLARAARPLSLRTFQRRFELADSTNHLVAVDIGARSDHTDEFVVFWFPRQRVVFETEQGWVTVDGKVRASRRAEKFMKTLAEEGIEPERLVQSWPMRGNRAELSRAELDSLILARKP
jgi:hypothetical protein